jgi:HSP20 family protein
MGMLVTRRNRLPSLWARDPLAALREEMNALRTQFIGEGEGWLSEGIVPALNVTETESAVEVRMDIPGIEAKDIDIQVVGNLLTIAGERKEEKEEKGKTFHRVECRSGSFSRAVTLPCSVTEDKVAAEYKDGVLKITMPKSEEAKAHKIKVKC